MNKIMTVGKLRKALEKFDSKTKLISASDDEGNSYSFVIFAPSEGRLVDGDFYNLGDAGTPEGGERVVCVN